MLQRISSINPTVAIRYSLLSLPLAALGLPFYIYAPNYLVETKGLGYGMVAALITAARIADAATDLPIGWLNDRFGGLRRWMLLGAALIVAGAFGLFSATAATSIAASIFLIFTGWSCIVVPWLTSVTAFPRTQQNSLIGWRESLLAVGTLLGLTLPALLGDQLMGILILALLTLLICILIQPKGASTGYTAIAKTNIDVPGHRPATLLALWALNTTANAAPGTVIILFVDQVLQAPNALSTVLVLFFIGALIGAAVGVPLIRRYGALTLWRWSILAACLSFAPAYFVNDGQTAVYLTICLFSGVFAGVDNVVPIALQGHWLSRRGLHQGRGQIYGAWSMTVKIGFGLAVALTFGLLSLGDSPAPDESAIRFAYVVIPVALKLTLLMLLLNKKITARLR